jgi:hypothetical protein
LRAAAKKGGDAMTEAEWLASTDLDELWDGFRGPRDRASERKVRLFACACCRRIFTSSADARLIAVVETAARHADGRAGDDELATAQVDALDARYYRLEALAGAAGLADSERRAAFVAAAAAHLLTYPRDANGPGYRTWTTVMELCDLTAARGPASAAEREVQAGLLRCVFGNPFRPAALDPAWLAWNDGAVAKMAGAIYEGRRFADLPILADALEDAGCDDADILAHCRSHREHVRGCWVIDLLLARE